MEIRPTTPRRLHLIWALCTVALLAGCPARMPGDRRMEDQLRYEPLEASGFFRDRMASRPLIEGTVPRGHLREDTHFYTGRVNGEPAREFPEDIEIDLETLRHGRERYDIFCSHCHDRAGMGNGMVVQAGYPRPPTFHSERLRHAPPGHIYDVISNGLGRMPPHAEQVPPRDRWTIVAYLQALQLSQHAQIDQLPEEDRQRLERERPANNERRKPEEHP